MKTAKAVPVLMYHHVSPNPGLVTVSPENFRAQMRHLAEHGWRTLGLDDLARFLSGSPLPEKSIVITFDDGYLDNWVHAHPVMAEFGLHGVIFIVTGWIGGGAPRPHAGASKLGAGETAPLPATPDHKTCKRLIADGRTDEVMLRWSEIEAMIAAGTFEFHSHTHTHTRWDQIETDPEKRLARLAADLHDSRETLRERLGKTTAHLCWPWGLDLAGYGQTADKLGYRYRYTTKRGVLMPTMGRDSIPRIVIKNRDGRWFGKRVEIYRRPWLATAYLALRGA